MAEEWVFEYVLEVFETPAWNGPIVEFVDAHAHMFRDLDENLLVYTTIHKQFAELIEAQLTKRLEEVGLSVEEFVAVLEKAAVSAPSASSGSTARVVLEQLLAVEDFAIFKRMMVKRRLEVEQETLRSIVASPQRAGKAADAAPVPAGAAAGKLTLDDVSAALAAVGAGKAVGSSSGAGGAPAGAALQDADDDVARAIRESLLEAEASRRLIEYERRMLELAIAESLQISQEAAAALLDSDDFWENSDLVEGLMAGSVHTSGSAQPASSVPAASIGPGGTGSGDGAAAAVQAPARGAAATVDAKPTAEERGAIPVISSPASAEPSVYASAAPPLSSSSRPGRAPVTASVEPVLHAGGSSAGPAPEPPAAATHSMPAPTARFGGSALPSIAAPSSAGALHRLPSLSAASMSRVTVDSLQLSASLFGSDAAGEGETAGRASASTKAERALPAAEPADPKAAAELRSRTLHWKQQRQALLAKKAQERERALQEYEREAEARKEEDGVRAEKRERAKAAAQAIRREADAGTAGTGGGASTAGGGDAGVDVRASLQAALLAKLRADMTGAGRS